MIQKQSLVLIRHGDTDFNSGANIERLRGWLDIPLNKEGIQEAGSMGRILRNVPFTKIYASNLSRTKDTATIIRQTLQVKQKRFIPTITAVSLKPWNMGDMQGQAVEQLTPIMLDYMKNPKIAVPGGESFATFLTRFLSSFRRILNETKTNGPILLVTHTRGLRAADAWFKGGQHSNNLIDDQPFMEKEHLHTGEGLIFTWNGRKWEREVLHNPMAANETKTKDMKNEDE